jgi:ubiquinone/menaquinone biosynthesis C-methylase UbiE
MSKALDNDAHDGAGISPDFYATLGVGLDTPQGMAYAAVEKLIKKHCLSTGNALDYGSGPGRSARFLRQAGMEKVVGVDISEKMLQKAMEQETPGVSYQLISSGTLPFKDNSFDLAFAGIVFVEISTEEEMRKILAELKRVTTDQGVIIFLTCTKAGYVHDSDPFKCLLTESQKQNLKDGDPVLTGIVGRDEKFTDYFWSDEFYKRLLKEVGLSLVETQLTSEGCYIAYVCKR